MADWKPNIFEYLDFRQYLRDYYASAKNAGRAFSFRYFSAKAGFASPNVLKLVIDGKRNVGEDSIPKFAKGLALSKEEERFFADLVAFDQADSYEAKNEAFERISAARRFRSARRLDHTYFTYLSHWYYPAVRELAGRPDFREDPAWIANELLPKITEQQAADTLVLLLELGLLVRLPDGRISRGDPSLTTGHEVRSLAIRNFHEQMLERAAASIGLVDREHRDLSALTSCISLQTVAVLKERMHAFRETCLDLCEKDENPAHVYQLNLQLFPLSQVPPPSAPADSNQKPARLLPRARGTAADGTPSPARRT